MFSNKHKGYIYKVTYVYKKEKNMEKNERQISWPSVIIGAILLVVAFLAFRNPLASLASLLIYFGLSAIFKGIISIITVNKVADKIDFNKTPVIVISVIDIILGIVILLNPGVSFLSLPFVLGAWFILDSISDLVHGRRLKKLSNGFYGLNIITSILTLILGIFMFVNPLSSYFTVVSLVGFYFAFAGIRNIVRGFMGY